MGDVTKRAYYSEQMSKRSGTDIWQGIDGNPVECTMAGEEPPGWSDTQYLGLVTCFICSGIPAQKPGDFIEE